MDVSVSVDALLSAEKFCRSEQSVALVTPGSCVAKTIFVKGRVGHVQREEGSTWGHHESHWY